jgi:hypothetical protein
LAVRVDTKQAKKSTSLWAVDGYTGLLLDLVDFGLPIRFGQGADAGNFVCSPFPYGFIFLSFLLRLRRAGGKKDGGCDGE